ncbi:MAG: PH domain-containing protein [Planctomycetota bacterium]|nr:PH domain-containing protein [Planctomycetota bacterium]
MTQTTATDASIHNEEGNLILLKAHFDPRLKTYFMLSSLFVLAISIIGLLLVPVWLIVGRSIHKRQYDALECELTERTLNFRKGFLFRIQKNVPLDKITDLALNEGPILRYFGLCSLTVETAGGGAGTATGHAVLVGIINPIEFRNAVMRQRDLVSSGGSNTLPAGPAAAVAGGASVLEDIRDSLGRIEKILEKKSS